MTPDEQRIEIAQACGWKYIKSKKRWNNPNGGHDYFSDLPDYINDLNAMHEAKQEIWRKEWGHRYTFNDYLAEIIKGRPVNRNEWNAETLIDATADQEAEAFLKTLNLWKP